MRPKELIRLFVERFNNQDVQGLAALYHENAVNHQTPLSELVGREAIRAMFKREFRQYEMVCNVENIFEDGDWGMLEWKDPKGLRGCGFFHVVDGLIVFQRGYWDRLSFLEQQGNG